MQSRDEVGYTWIHKTVNVSKMHAKPTHCIFIFIFIFIVIQVHHVTCTLGLLSHVVPCIRLKMDGNELVISSDDRIYAVTAS